MTRRERMERRADRRREWAEKADKRAAGRFDRAKTTADGIPLGQPILVGHHSERRARKDQERIRSNMDKGVAESRLSLHHERKADGIESQLKRSVFSDDHDAVERLRERIAENEAQRDRYKAINRAWRKSKGDIDKMTADGTVSVALGKTIKDTMRMAPWLKSPFDTVNVTARIRRDKKRIDDLLNQGTEQ
jgi:hypothetical protein